MNADKTKVVIFSKKVVRKQFKFKLKDKFLEVVDHVKYLGGILNNKLCNDFDIDKCYISFNPLRTKFIFSLFSGHNLRLYQLTVKYF